jgi:hypothetical protein
LVFHCCNQRVSAGLSKYQTVGWGLTGRYGKDMRGHLPEDICSVENCKTGIILIVSHVEICFEIVCFSISRIRSIQERTKEEES